MTGPVLILGGTTEARELAGDLVGEHRVITSLAGRVRAPKPLPGEVRIGGFGGVDGLVEWLRTERVAAVVDATHPFAAQMTEHAVAATAQAGVPYLRLDRPGVPPDPAWTVVPTLAAAPAALTGDRVFLTTGRQHLAVFADCPQWFLVRAVDPPTGPAPARMQVLLDRGPFTVEGERKLLREHRIDVLVTKDSGGGATAAKLEAARTEEVAVVLVARPPAPAGVATVADVASAAEWVRTTLASRTNSW
ncbi:cobalt-precorrin-6A reductase [Pseudonocardia thermophila]|uniref:cobalt-precorrin-6A reductase n=1 Tax=Pseudonocardia thermophila TaxID=1848 RepID=UPI00248DC382|nr:cobalt-precorrin-6A reductase [Pseudonocardia thermophila]